MTKTRLPSGVFRTVPPNQFGEFTANNVSSAGRNSLPEDTLQRCETFRALPVALLRAREAVMGPIRPILLARAVTEQQWRVICVLAAKSPLDATEVAERACLFKASLTRIIRVLEARKLITRTSDAIDGRRIHLAIAPAGSGMLHEIATEISAVYAKLETRYGDQRAELLLDMLGDLAELKD